MVMSAASSELGYELSKSFQAKQIYIHIQPI